MQKLLEIIENPKIAEHLPSAIWLTSPKNRGEGRTTCLAAAFILNAVRNPGTKIDYYDHHSSDTNAREIIRKKLEDLCSYITVDSRNIQCNRTVKIIRNIPKAMVKGSVIDLVRSAVKLAKENDIDIDELTDIIKQEMVHSVMDT